MKRKAIALLSGGLDSTLAIKLILEQGIDVEALNFTTLLDRLQVKDALYVTVELNGEILDRPAFDGTMVKGGDTVEFLYFMGGGK